MYQLVTSSIFPTALALLMAVSTQSDILVSFGVFALGIVLGALALIAADRYVRRRDRDIA